VSRRSLWIIAGTIAVIVIAASIAWFLVPHGDAEDQAHAYLRALADGDVAAVEATGVDIPATTASAFAEASDRIGEGRIESSTADDHSATVTVSYELAGARHESILTLSQREGRWVLETASALGSVRLHVPVGIAGTVLPPSEAQLLPAMYDVNAAPADFFDGSARIEVLPGSTQEVDVDATLRPEATATAQTHLDDYLEACTQPAAEAAPSCGIMIPWAADFSAVREIRYRIEQTPVISITPSTFRADDGTLVATVAGTALDGSEKSLTYRTTNWSVRGDVSFTDDDIVLSVW
jgi:hypothetical protein